jgi:hypothetical protein
VQIPLSFWHQYAHAGLPLGQVPQCSTPALCVILTTSKRAPKWCCHQPQQSPLTDLDAGSDSPVAEMPSSCLNRKPAGQTGECHWRLAADCKGGSLCCEVNRTPSLLQQMVAFPRCHSHADITHTCNSIAARSDSDTRRSQNAPVLSLHQERPDTKQTSTSSRPPGRLNSDSSFAPGLWRADDHPKLEARAGLIQ